MKREFSEVLQPVENSEISVLNAKENVLKKINVSFIVHFSFSKYNFSLNTF